MTASQYIDFQNFYKQYDDFMPNLAACFLLPNGKKYGEDYDPIDEAEFLNTHLTIDIFSDIMFFFCKLIASINAEYPTLFGKGDEEETKENQGQTGKEETSEELNTDETINPFTQKK